MENWVYSGPRCVVIDMQLPLPIPIQFIIAAMMDSSMGSSPGHPRLWKKAGSEVIRREAPRTES